MKIGFEYQGGNVVERLGSADLQQTGETGRRIFIQMLSRSIRQPELLGSPSAHAYKQTLYDLFLDRFFELLSRADAPASELGRERMGRFMEIAGFSRAALNGAPAGRDAERFLQLFFNGEKIRLMADADALFSQLVYRRMIPKNEGVRIDKKPGCVVVPRPLGQGLLVLPLWKAYDENEKADRAALEKLCRQEGCDNGYLVYPKQAGFKRFIRLENPQLRMVAAPYSFSFCARAVREDYL